MMGLNSIHFAEKRKYVAKFMWKLFQFQWEKNSARKL